MKKNILDKLQSLIKDNDRKQARKLYKYLVAISATMTFVHLCDDLRLTSDERMYIFSEAYGA